MKTTICVLAVLGLATAADAQRLFVGLETSIPLSTRSTDLSGFPDVNYDVHFAIDVSGAAAAPDGTLYLCNGAFNTDLYRSVDFSTPQFIADLSVDISALAYGRGMLFGFSNYAEPKGIYQIDTTTGQCTLVLDVFTGYQFRFFGLDYNPVDDLFYGYTEYGDSGLYSINIDTGVMIKVAPSIPASNTQGRGLAVGNNTVYLTATRGDDDIPFFAWDLSQSARGEWVGFTNPYTDQHATGGAAWIPGPCPADVNNDGVVDIDDLFEVLGHWGEGPGQWDVNDDGTVDIDDIFAVLAAWGPCT